MKCVPIEIKNMSKMHPHEGRTEELYWEVGGHVRVVRFSDDLFLLIISSS